MNKNTDTQYHFRTSDASHTAAYLFEPIMNTCRELNAKRIFDLGCGNGAMCGALKKQGFEVVGCDPSSDGIAIATRTYPEIRFVPLGVYDDAQAIGESNFDVVVSAEVVEHLFSPRALPRFAKSLLKPGGHLILTTPYHGYLKNLALAVTGSLDKHFTALWDGGHIKFWSRHTLTKMLEEEGFELVKFMGAGRLPYLWKSMILVFKLR
jgi:2-polyprenyl-3-methyl-5-hydroxy-6-metoxy-1,4-benzoquinol methylase